MNIHSDNRGPLNFIILAATRQDVSSCANCQNCDDLHSPEMDLSFGDVMRAASHDDPIALTNRTIWVSDGVLESMAQCQAGLDFPAVIHTLRREAETRGITKKR